MLLLHSVVIYICSPRGVLNRVNLYLGDGACLLLLLLGPGEFPGGPSSGGQGSFYFDGWEGSLQRSLA